MRQAGDRVPRPKVKKKPKPFVLKTPHDVGTTAQPKQKPHPTKLFTQPVVKAPSLGKGAQRKVRKARNALPAQRVAPSLPKLPAPTAAQRKAASETEAASLRQHRLPGESGTQTIHRIMSDAKLRKSYQTFLRSTPAERAKAKKTAKLIASLPSAHPGPKPTKIDIAGVNVLPAITTTYKHLGEGLKPGLATLKLGDAGTHILAGAALGKSPKQSLNENPTFSDVLRKHGVHGPLASIAGFGLDVAANPTTYVTFGAGSVAEKAAQKAAERVAAKAVKAGMTKEVADRLGQQAAKKVLRESGGAGRKSATVTVAKKTVNTRITAPKLAKEEGAARDLAKVLNPRITPTGATRAEHTAVRTAQRAERGAHSHSMETLMQRASQFGKQFTETEQRQMLDAIESKSIGKLADARLKQGAIRIRSDFRHLNRLERQAGVRAAQRENYVYHLRSEKLEQKAGKGFGGRAKFSPGQARKINKTLRQLREADLRDNLGSYVQDLPTLMAVRGEESLKAVGRAKTTKAVVDQGKPLTRKALANLGEHEGVYLVQPGKSLAEASQEQVQRALIKPEERVAMRHLADALEREAKGVTGKRAKTLLAKAQVIRKDAQVPPNGKLVILNHDFVDRLSTRAAPKGSVGRAGQRLTRRYDRAQGVYKTALTVLNPGYHPRNFIGDNWNSFLTQNLASLARNNYEGAKVANELRRIRKGEGAISVKPTDVTKGTLVKIKGRGVPAAEIANDARKLGVIDQGFYGRDVLDLLQRPASGHGPVELSRRLGQYRENVVRLNTYIGGLKQGLSKTEAAQRATDVHFDYGELSSAERKLRRVAPFYTFTARNTPLQARSLVTRPGKYANFESLREEAAKAAGLNNTNQKDYQRKLKEYEQLGIPVPIPGVKVGGKPALAFMGLPVTDLNRLTPNPAEQVKQLGQMVTGFKTIPELVFNYSLFFRGQIDSGRPVSAPNWVGSLPDSAKKKLGVVKLTDKKTGQRVWKWNARVDYAVKQLPQLSALLQAMTSGTSRRGQGPALSLLNQTGVRVQPYDPVQFDLNQAFSRYDKLEAARGRTDAGSPERKALNKQISHAAAEITNLQKKLHYKILFGQSTKGKGSGSFLDTGTSTGKSFLDSGSSSSTSFLDH